MTPIFAKKIIFDLDGTLVDTAPDLLAATNHVLHEINRAPVTLEQVRHMVGFGAMKLIELGLKATGGVNRQDTAELLQSFLKYYADNVAVNSRPFPDTINVLQALKSDGFGLAICTNKPHHLAKSLLHDLNMTQYFECIIGGDSLPYKKPDPRPILSAINALPGTGPAIMIGDSIADIDGARAANIPSILVTFGYSAIPHDELNADLTITAMADLPACVTLGAIE
ncbi:phosphoglycolate phosphatase [Kordiimonas aquimaris]|uniref:phosphoglycolate phosphatase n=1 Tax=Kordiimonas aquimaris TaxID=707591 RepID=UPI0021D2F6AD|nr:phosphoglycolate phosphatase [Kordiimonas aquimaris]